MQYIIIIYNIYIIYYNNNYLLLTYNHFIPFGLLPLNKPPKCYMLQVTCYKSMSFVLPLEKVECHNPPHGWIMAFKMNQNRIFLSHYNLNTLIANLHNGYSTGRGIRVNCCHTVSADSGAKLNAIQCVGCNCGVT